MPIIGTAGHTPRRGGDVKADEACREFLILVHSVAGREWADTAAVQLMFLHPPLSF